MITRATLDQLTSAIMAELAGSPDLVSELMAETGLQPGDLRRLAADRSDDLAAALLDFICAADSRLEQFAAKILIILSRSKMQVFTRLDIRL